MNFKELREANLSKAQIKKVHDKADDLPKSDFIKRYGKDGDSVRFATATNIVKKKLGMDEGIFGKLKFPRPDVVNKPLPSKDSYGRGDVKTIELPIPGTTFKGKLNGSKKSEALDKEDEKSVGRVVKGLKKAVKAHQGQVDALTKDIKDEVAPVARAKAALDVAVAKKSAKAAAAVKQKTKDKADVQRLLDRQKRLRAVARRNEEVVTEARIPSDNDIKKKHGNATPMKSYKQGFDAANKGKKITTNPHKSMFSFDRGAWEKGFKDADQGFDIKTLSQRDYDRNGKIKKEEVVTEAVSDGQVAQARRMTDKNDHFGARKYLASIIRDKEMMQMYDSLEKMHRMDLGGNDALTLRGKLDKKLEFRLTQKLKKDAKRLLDAL